MGYISVMIQFCIMTLKAIFGRNLATARKSAGLTQEQLAEICDVTIETISNIERGLKGPRFDLIEKLAAAVSVDPHQLFRPEP